MRKLLLASAFALGAVGTVGDAFAQAGPSPLQGQLVAPPGAVPGANNNNSSFGTARPGASAVPTPGTVVIHLNARVTVEWASAWNSVTNQAVPATGAGSGFKANNATELATYARLYPGMDGMAANGLRYGGAIEIRNNFGPALTNSNNSPGTQASGYTSSQTWFIRRAFAYLGADQVGIVRVGEGDGLMSLYDGGRTTFQFVTPSGGLNGSDLNGLINGNTSPPFAFSTVSGNEYTSQKIVYLSPSFAGFDFGLQYSPHAFNDFNACAIAATTCSNLSASAVATDGARYQNMFNFGGRYNGQFGPLAVLAYGVYGVAGHVTTNALPATTPGGVRIPGNRYDNLNYGNAGVALTYAGFTIGGNYIGGAVNGQLAARPSGGAGMNAWLVGVAYQAGPLTVGGSYESIDSQGAATLAGLSQRHEYALDVGVSYALAPGLVVFSDYIYQNRKQSGWNFATGTLGAGFNQVQGQGFLLGTTVAW